jgi:signal transduction histidine kinase/ActR/RegA family two-component response regulator
VTFGLPTSLRIRFLLLAGGFFVLSSLALAGFYYYRARVTLLDEMRKRGHALTSSLAFRLAEPLKTGDLRAAETEVIAACADPDISYVLLQDRNGQVVAQAVTGIVDLAAVRSVLAARSWRPLSIQQVETVDTRGGTLHNFSAPIWGGSGGAGGDSDGTRESARLGTLRIGYATRPIIARVDRAFWFGLSVWGLVAALGLVGLGVITRWALDPLRRMADAALSIAGGDLSQRVEASGDDEIGRLGRAFNEMTGGLASSREILARRNAQLETAIAEHERSLAELKEAQERLAHSESTRQTEKLRTVGQMASGMAHDFNNVLSVITGRAQLLRLKSSGGRLTPTELGSSLQIVERAALDGAETVRRLQEFSRNRSERALVSTDLHRLLRDAVEITRPRWKDQAEQNGAHIDLALELQPVEPFACVPSELREMLTNLVFNAVDAMPEGGAITLGVRPHGDGVRLVVRDTGHGIAPEHRERIFEPFFTTKGVRGNGLGLPIVYGIVQRHGGSIVVDGPPGGGTEIRIDLPLSTVPAPAEEAPATPVAPRSRLLVVDDEPNIRQLLNDLLTALGHEVTVAAGGPDALARFAPGAFDVVFTDLGMPEMSGWDLARELAAREPDLPIVLLTGWGHEVSLEDARRRHVRAVVAKPFTADQIVGAIAEVRSCRRAA